MKIRCAPMRTRQLSRTENRCAPSRTGRSSLPKNGCESTGQTWLPRMIPVRQVPLKGPNRRAPPISLAHVCAPRLGRAKNDARRIHVAHCNALANPIVVGAHCPASLLTLVPMANRESCTHMLATCKVEASCEHLLTAPFDVKMHVVELLFAVASPVSAAAMRVARRFP